MNKERIFLLILIVAGLIILIYVCHILMPLLDDVWKVLAIGITAGFIGGWWCGDKWRKLDEATKKDYKEYKKDYEEYKKEYEVKK